MGRSFLWEVLLVFFFGGVLCGWCGCLTDCIFLAFFVYADFTDYDILYYYYDFSFPFSV